MEKKNFYITTPLFYANGRPHNGHLYTKTLADVKTRYLRLCGHNVLFLTGLDEHGEKVVNAAINSNKEVREYLGEINQFYSILMEAFYISPDIFYRTSEEDHKIYTTAFIEDLWKSKEIYKDIYKGYYAVKDEDFVSPYQVEKKDGKLFSKETGAEVRESNEIAYFLKTKEKHDMLTYLMKSRKRDFLRPKKKRREALQMLKLDSLGDLCISRKNIGWGIPLPFDNEKSLYVWVDALLGYYGAFKKIIGIEGWESNWNIEHIIGKEIVKFHAIFLPALLFCKDQHSLDKNPPQIYSHGWITIKGEKVSKSLGHQFKDPSFLADFREIFRYYAITEGPLENDRTADPGDMVELYNQFLVNKYSNLFYRILSMLEKYKVESFSLVEPLSSSEKKGDIDMANSLRNLLFNSWTYQKNTNYIDLWKIFNDKSTEMEFNHKLYIPIMCPHKSFIDIGNKIIDSNKPWDLYKDGKNSKLQSTLYISLLCWIFATIELLPVLPHSAEKALRKIGITYEDAKFLITNFAYDETILLENAEKLLASLNVKEFEKHKVFTSIGKGKNNE